jgi:hypothetical protein
VNDMFIGLPPESRLQRFFGSLKKIHPGVQAAIIAGIFSLIGIWYGSQIKSAKLQSKVTDLEGTISERDLKIRSQSSEIQRLETLLTPFRTIALEKFTGPEKESLNELAEYITNLQKKYNEQTEKLDSIQKEVAKTKLMYGPPHLSPVKKEITKTKDGSYVAIVQFRPSNNSRVDGYTFTANVDYGYEKARIASFEGSVDHHAMATGDGFISKNGQFARCVFNPLSGFPTVKLVVTEPCKVMLLGNHLRVSCIVDIK